MNIPNWVEIVLYIILGAIIVYFRNSAAAKAKVAEIESWTGIIKGSVASLISRAEKEFNGAKRGGEKFEWVVNKLYGLLPIPIQAVITRDIIADIVQGTFDSMAAYAAKQADKFLTSEQIAPEIPSEVEG